MSIFFVLLTNCDNKESPRQPSPPITSHAPNSVPIMTHLATADLDREIAALAEIGVTRYADPATGLMADRVAAFKEPNLRERSGGGRKGDWIKTTFKEEEDHIVNAFKQLNAPRVYTIEEIDREFTALMATHPPDATLAKANFVLVKGVNVSYLHDAPLGQNSFIQLASQFNYLEATSPLSIASVLSYLGDKTQGPMGSIEAAAAALHRTAAVLSGRLPHALIDILPAGHANYYKNGYLEMFKINNNAQQFAELKNYVQANIKKLGILAQWVIHESNGAMNIQVFAAAPSYQGAAAPAFNSVEGEICTMLVAAQYEALAKLAAIRTFAIGGKVAVHYALVGGDAFRNPPEVRAEGFRRAANVLKGYPNVKVFVHGFEAPGQNEIRTYMDKNVVNLTEMDAATFYASTL